MSNSHVTYPRPAPGEPIRVCVTGAAGRIAYSLLYMIANGEVFGPNQPVILQLLDVSTCRRLLGVQMELEDCAFPLLESVITTSDPEVAFKNVDWAILLGAMPRKEGMARSDLMRANVRIFREQGEALNRFAKKSVRVVVVGNPCNTNAMVAAKYAPTIPKCSFSALTRLDENRARSLIAQNAKVPPNCVKNVCVWGNHSNTQVPLCEFGYLVDRKTGAQSPINQVLRDRDYLRNQFVSTVARRGSAILAVRKLSSAMSAAKAVADHVRDWYCGTKEGEWVSMAVFPHFGADKGTAARLYDIPEDVVFSVPVQIDALGHWKVVGGLDLDQFARSKLAETAAELESERADALAILARAVYPPSPSEDSSGDDVIPIVCP